MTQDTRPGRRQAPCREVHGVLPFSGRTWRPSSVTGLVLDVGPALGVLACTLLGVHYYARMAAEAG